MLKRAGKSLLFLGLSLIFWMGVLALVNRETALAYFVDPENSSGNSFQAGALDFQLSSSQDFAPLGICPSETTEREIDLSNQGNPFSYKIETTENSGELCSYITLEANLDGGAAECTGNLIGFTCQEFLFPQLDGSTPQQWYFRATLTEGAPENSVCHFKFRYSGWQISPNLGGFGFVDQEEIENTISSGTCQPMIKILINKVYYDPDSNHGTEPANEWIELYNPNDFGVDLGNWQVCDNTNCDILSSVTIPPQGFVLISGSNSTWAYWEAIPAGVPKIVLSDGKIGNGLANDSDRVVLKNPGGQIVDAMSYGADNYAFTPPCPDVAEGHILARVPTGIDTDTAADWKDLGLPQVIVTYPTGGTWYCGRTYTLRWTATNPNGPNSDLKITLLYIRDLDGNGIVSSGDGVTVIAQDIANTGRYNWKVSPCYLGYVWIKVIAKGPENFMVSGSGLSGRVYEPDPPAGEAEGTDCLLGELGQCLVESETQAENPLQQLTENSQANQSLISPEDQESNANFEEGSNSNESNSQNGNNESQPESNSEVNNQTEQASNGGNDELGQNLSGGSKTEEINQENSTSQESISQAENSNPQSQSGENWESDNPQSGESSAPNETINATINETTGNSESNQPTSESNQPTL